MSQLLIQQYLNQLETLKKVSGTTRESVVREAFNVYAVLQDPVYREAGRRKTAGATGGV